MPLFISRRARRHEGEGRVGKRRDGRKEITADRIEGAAGKRQVMGRKKGIWWTMEEGRRRRKGGE